jgi:catechol 2,3-dioxygenase-like lactoylglutathione lyase family enzyme
MPGQPILFIATANASAALEFYGQKLGFSLLVDDPFALVFDCDGTMLRIQKVDDVQAQPYTVLGWAVDDIAVSVTSLSAGGVEFQRYEHMEQDELGIWSSPGGGKIAWFQDPDGNTLSLTELIG